MKSQAALALYEELHRLAEPERVPILLRFFQTGPGQYAEGDVFWGIRMPNIRQLVRKWRTRISPEELLPLLHDPVHEVRMTVLLLWTAHYPKLTAETQQQLIDTYLSQLAYVNNWDLVDLSAPYLLGRHLYENPSIQRTLLDQMVQAPHLWTQRVALVSTLYLIKKGEFDDIERISVQLLKHPHHLIHKAMGWMWREVGKRDRDRLEVFLHTHIQRIPRTSLRYAIEHFSATQRAYYLTLT